MMSKLEVGEYYVDERDGEIIRILADEGAEIIKEGCSANGGREGQRYVVNDSSWIHVHCTKLSKLKRILLIGEGKD